MARDHPVDLPEGTVLNLVIDDEGDELDEREREALRAAISRSLQQAAEGRAAPAEAIIEKVDLVDMDLADLDLDE